MRATPLAIWGHRLPLNVLAACARQDAQLSHTNETTQDANACYVIACASLIAQPGDSEAALAAAEGWAGVHGCAEVQAWLAEARGGGMESYRASPLIGFVKHAFLLAFFHLRERSSFEAGLRHTLLCGGDTGGWLVLPGLLGGLGTQILSEVMRWTLCCCPAIEVAAITPCHTSRSLSDCRHQCRHCVRFAGRPAWRRCWHPRKDEEHSGELHTCQLRGDKHGDRTPLKAAWPGDSSACSSFVQECYNCTG
jgi:hypothetical protein